MKSLFALMTLAFSFNCAANFGTDNIGVVTSFNYEKGYGYIAPLRGGAALYFRSSAIARIPEFHDGTCVTYKIREFPDHHIEAVNINIGSCY